MGNDALILPTARHESWITLRSAHLELHTNLRRERALETLKAFETRYDLLATMLFQQAEPPSFTTKVVVFADEDQFRWFHPKARAYFLPSRWGSIGEAPTIVTYGAPDVYAYQTWLHELTHRFLAQALGRMPTWLNEGMAEYYATVTLHEGKAVLGEPLVGREFVMGSQWQFDSDPFSRAVLAPTSQAVPPSKLHALERSDFYVRTKKKAPSLDESRASALNYLSAWAFVHMMMSTDSPISAALHSALAEASAGADVGLALESRLNELGWSEVDEAFFEHLARRETQLWRQPYVAREIAEPKISKMGDAAVLALYAELGGTRYSDMPRKPEALIDAALTVDPLDSTANILAAQISRQQGKLEQAHQQLEASSTNGFNTARLWAAKINLYGLTSGHEPPWSEAQNTERLEQALHGLSETAQSSSELNLLAWELAHHEGRAEDAVAYARRSVQQDPACWECWDTYAFAEAQRNNYETAAKLQDMAVNWAGEYAKTSAIHKARQRARQYRAAAQTQAEAEE